MENKMNNIRSVSAPMFQLSTNLTSVPGFLTSTSAFSVTTTFTELDAHTRARARACTHKGIRTRMRTHATANDSRHSTKSLRKKRCAKTRIYNAEFRKTNGQPVHLSGQSF